MSASLPWLAGLLGIVIAIDAALCAIPLAAIKTDLDRMAVSEPVQRILVPIKLAGSIGLIVGLWVPALGLAAAICLVAYFALAIGVHVRVHDPAFRSLPALGFLLWALASAVFSFTPAL